jgi:hypothetical protein
MPHLLTVGPLPSKDYGAAVARVTAVLAEHDPASVIAHGAPAEEYEAEARELVRRLGSGATLTDALEEVLDEYLEVRLSKATSDALAADLRSCLSN